MKDENIFPAELIESFAEEIHKRWLAIEKAANSTKPTAKEWKELPDDIKDSNRQQALDIIRKLQAFDYSVVPASKAQPGDGDLTANEIEQMSKMEHDRWSEERTAKGWVYGPVRNDQLKIHAGLVPWEQLSEDIRQLDRNAIIAIPALLKKAGYVAVKTKR